MALERKFLKQHFGISQNSLFSFQDILMSASLSFCPGLVPALSTMLWVGAPQPNTDKLSITWRGFYPSFEKKKSISLK